MQQFLFTSEASKALLRRLLPHACFGLQSLALILAMPCFVVCVLQQPSIGSCHAVFCGLHLAKPSKLFSIPEHLF